MLPRITTDQSSLFKISIEQDPFPHVCFVVSLQWIFILTNKSSKELADLHNRIVADAVFEHLLLQLFKLS